jgi:hypothetical protein
MHSSALGAADWMVRRSSSSAARFSLLNDARYSSTVCGLVGMARAYLKIPRGRWSAFGRSSRRDLSRSCSGPRLCEQTSLAPTPTADCFHGRRIALSFKRGSPERVPVTLGKELKPSQSGLHTPTISRSFQYAMTVSEDANRIGQVLRSTWWLSASFSNANFSDPVTLSARKTRFNIFAFEVSSGSAKPRRVHVFEHVDVDDSIEMVRYFASN